MAGETRTGRGATDSDLNPVSSSSSSIETFASRVGPIRTSLWIFSTVVACWFAIEGWFSNAPDELGSTFFWSHVVTALSVIGFFFGRNRRLEPWAALIGISSIHANLAAIEFTHRGAILGGFAIILLWTGVFLKPRYNLLVASYALIGLLLSPVTIDFSSIGDGPYVYPIVLILYHLGLPLFIGALIHYSDRINQREVQHSIDLLHQRQVELAELYRQKNEELEQSRIQLLQAQSFKAVGTIASGLAHELNNILTPIRGLAELLADGDTSPDQSKRYGESILAAAVSAARITDALLTYSRQGNFRPIRSNARQLLENEILPHIRNSLPNSILLNVEVADPLFVAVDRELFRECLIKIIANAIDAMPDGGTITLALFSTNTPCTLEVETIVGLIDPPRPYVPKHGEISPESSVAITIRDSGIGIESDNLGRIFEPFFTTKTVGSGAGLGLAMAHGIVARHGGRMMVHSQTGQGTTISILLPSVDGERRENSQIIRLPSSTRINPVAWIVADDEDLLDELEEILVDAQYRPICQQHFDFNRDLPWPELRPDDLVIVDLDLLQQSTLCQIHPRLSKVPLVLLTKQPITTQLRELAQNSQIRVIRKPVDRKILVPTLTKLCATSSEPATMGTTTEAT